MNGSSESQLRQGFHQFGVSSQRCLFNRMTLAAYPPRLTPRMRSVSQSHGSESGFEKC